MAGSPPAKRRYDSTRRQAQAAATRSSILLAAQRRFEAEGYVPATMEAIATDAGVALKTVYAAFGTKSGVLRATWDLVLKGDLDDAPVADRPWYVAVLEETNPRRQVELIVRASCAVKRRIGAMLRVIRGAASVDPDAGALWDLIQSDFHANQAVLVASIDDHGGLRRGLDPDTATDVLWALNHPDQWLLLVGERGWTPERFEAWFAEAARLQLLGGRSGEVAW